MENKTRKVYAAAVLVMLCAVAIVGAGYAAFSGTANTYNENSSATAGYMTVGGSDWTAISATTDVLPISTYTYHKMVETTDTNFTAFYLNDYIDVSVKTGTDSTTVNYYVAEVSGADKAYTVTNYTGSAISKIKFTSDAAGTFTDLTNSDFKYILKVTDGTNSVYCAVQEAKVSAELTLASAIAAADASTGTITVQLCVGFAKAVSPSTEEYLPSTMIGAPAASGTVVVHSVSSADLATKKPVDLASISFAFEIADATTTA